MGVRRAQDLAVQHARQLQIGPIHRPAGHLGHAVGTNRARANPFEALTESVTIVESFTASLALLSPVSHMIEGSLTGGAKARGSQIPDGGKRPSSSQISKGRARSGVRPRLRIAAQRVCMQSANRCLLIEVPGRRPTHEPYDFGPI